jgi:hypothetical protein
MEPLGDSERLKEECEEFFVERDLQRENLKSSFISLFLLLAVDKTNIITRY